MQAERAAQAEVGIDEGPRRGASARGDIALDRARDDRARRALVDRRRQLAPAALRADRHGRWQARSARDPEHLLGEARIGLGDRAADRAADQRERLRPTGAGVGATSPGRSKSKPVLAADLGDACGPGCTLCSRKRARARSKRNTARPVTSA